MNPRSARRHGSLGARMGLHWPLLRGHSSPGAPESEVPVETPPHPHRPDLVGSGHRRARVVGQSAEAADSRCNRTNDSVRKLLECVTLDGVLEHQQAFQEIADENGGTRASGTAGYDESADYVERRLERAGYDVSRQEFTFHAFSVIGDSALQQTAPSPTTYVEDTDFAPTPQSEPGDITRGHSGGPRPGDREHQHQRLPGRGLQRLPGRQHRPDPARHVHLRRQGQQRRRRWRRRHHLLQRG